MTLLQFRPVDGRLDEILSMLMHSREVASHPSLSYAIRLVSEEIIVNILNYAYPQQAEGYLTLCLWDEDGEITLEFIDGGIPFNPLDKADPDISLPLEQREIGGLGIFLVREMMDDVVTRKGADPVQLRDQRYSPDARNGRQIVVYAPCCSVFVAAGCFSICPSRSKKQDTKRAFGTIFVRGILPREGSLP